MIISAFIKQQTLTLPRKTWVAGSRDYVGVSVTYQTADWAGLRVTAFFGNEADPKNLYTVDIVNGKIPPDKHINLSAGKWKIWFVGYDPEGTQKVSTQAETVEITATGCTCDDFPEVPYSYAEDFARRLSALEAGGGGSGGGGQGGPSDAVRYGAPQDLSEKEKEQARKNIGAGSVMDLSAQVQRAETAARTAESSRESAVLNAQTATSAAETATGAASAAAGSAQSASTDAGRAEAAQSAANGSAATAQQQADAAAGSAQDAATQAENASSSATTAQQNAEAAAGSAQTASTAAGNSSTYADASRQNAENAFSSAETAKDEADRAKREADRAAQAGTGGGSISAEGAGDTIKIKTSFKVAGVGDTITIGG